MGADYSSCLGYERNKQPKFGLSFQQAHQQNQQMEMWPQQSISVVQSGRIMVTSNEQYMVKKQETLNLHLIPCAKLKQRFEQLCDSNFDQELSQTEFCAMLVNCKLLKADFPRQDDRWLKFYSKLTVIDDEEVGVASTKGRYELVPALIALIALSQGTADFKAKAICELFSGKRFLKPQPLGIRANKMKQEMRSQSQGGEGALLEGRPSLDEYTRKAVLTKDQLRSIVSIIVNLSLSLLPIFASDVDAEHTRQLTRTLIQWHQKRGICIDNLISHFRSSKLAHNDVRRKSAHQPSSITVRQFIDTAKQLDVFNMMVVREMAKQTQVISDINPNINKETALQRDLFHTSRRTIEQLNETLTDAVPLDIPAIEAEAALYRIERDFSTYFQTESRVREKRNTRTRSQSDYEMQNFHSALR